jgi:hypothetical protein
MSEPSEFERDVGLLVQAIRSDEPATPEVLDAVARIARHTLVSVASIAESLRRIADAQELVAAVVPRVPHAELPAYTLFDWRKDYPAIIRQTEE